MGTFKQTRGPLEGVRVLDLTIALSGPYGSMLLGDLGAEVIKVEAITPAEVEFGSRTALNPQYSFKGQEAYYLSINRNKKSLGLNLKAPEGRQLFWDLCKKSDVVFNNFRPGVMKKLGIDYETLKKVNPRIICCSLTGFGSSGPYKDRPAFDIIAQGMSGGMSITGEPGSPPTRAGIPVGDLAGGMFAAHGIMAALYSRERTGEGQNVDVSLLDGQISMLNYVAANYLICGVEQGQLGSRHQTNPVYGAFKTKDGYVTISAHRRVFWENFCRATGDKELVKDPRFDTAERRMENVRELWDILDKIFATKTTADWLYRLEKADVPCGPVNSISQALNDPQVLHRDMVVTLEHPDGSKIRLAGNPVKMSGTGKQVYEYPPVLGQQTDEVLSKILGYSAEKIVQLKRDNIVV